MSIKKIKVCFISHFGYPLYNKKCKEPFGGGAEVQLYLLSKEFAKNENLEVSVITGSFKINDNSVEIIDNIFIYKVLPLKKKITNYFKGVIIFFKTLIKIKPDVVIQRCASVTTFLSTVYSKLLKKKFIYSISHENDVNGVSEKGILGKFFKSGLDNASFIVAQNNDQIIALENYKNRSIENIRVIRSGFEINIIDDCIKKSILWVGRAIQFKRPYIYLKLAQKFPNEKFIIICKKDIDENYKRTIYDEAYALTNLELIEFVPFHEINQFFKNAKVLVNTSTNEGFPNTFIQALMNKTPILSQNVDPDDILTKRKIGINCNNSFIKMVNSLRKLLNNRSFYESYSNNGYSYVLNNHNIKDIANKWIKLIKKVLKN